MADGQALFSQDQNMPTRVRPTLSIAIPTYCDDPTDLIGALALDPQAALCEIIVFDDGSADRGLVDKIETALAAFPSWSQLIVSPNNNGRSAGRNQLAKAARSDWILYLDADMVPADRMFLDRYIAEVETDTRPRVIVGGFSPPDKVPRGRRLHAALARRSDCRPAAMRNLDPGRHVFTSNMLVHRTVLDSITFDDGYRGWGWEDVDWGLRVVDWHPVVHIDNAAVHTGLDPDAALLSKHAGSGDNFARLTMRHPKAAQRMPLYRAARAFKRTPLLGVVKAVSARLAVAPGAPMSLRCVAVKAHRAAAYAEALK